MSASIKSDSLRIENVNLSIASQTLVDNFSLTIQPGNVCTIMGPSGCGKSSLLDYISGSLDSEFHSSGSIYIGNDNLNNLAPEKRQIGILFQDALLFNHLSVRGNLAFALPNNILKSERQQIIEKALSDAGLSNMEARDPATLSGGQRARIALLRTLLSSPRALLLDEPFSKLDPHTRKQFREFVFQHAAEAELPTLLVTHDPEDAKAAGGMVINF